MSRPEEIKMSADTTAHDGTRTPDTYPVWTVRLVWRVTGVGDRPKHTYELAGSEPEAVDRAVFALDHYQNTGANVLVCAHIKRCDGWWEMPSLDTRLARHEYLYAAFQQAPSRPS
jgi:hypothetical protein